MEKRQIAYVVLAVFMVFLAVVSSTSVDVGQMIDTGSCLVNEVINGDHTSGNGCWFESRVEARECSTIKFKVGQVPSRVTTDAGCNAWVPTTVPGAAKIAEAEADAMEEVGDITVTPPAPPADEDCPTECPPSSSCTGPVVDGPSMYISCTYTGPGMFTQCKCIVSACAKNTCTWGCMVESAGAPSNDDPKQELARSDSQKELPMIHTQVFW